MNILGITITRGKPSKPQDDLTLTPAVKDADGNLITQARLFAATYARDAARGMLDIVRSVQTRAGKIARIALSASIPHQIGYVIALSIPYMHWGTIPGAMESVTMIAMAFAAPVAGDLLILSCIETIGGAAVMHADKVKAMRIMVVPVAASGYVNFLVTGPLLLKCLSAFVVTMVPLAVSLRFIRPDFATMDEMETGVAKSIDEAREKAAAAKVVVVATPIKSRPSRKEQKANKSKAESIAKANPNMSVAMLVRESGVSRPTAIKVLAAVNTSTVHPVAAVEKLEDIAPVSPAVVVVRKRK